MSTNNADSWWKEYFPEYHLLTEGVNWDFNPDFIESALELHKGDTVLDLACGYGRVSLALASSGYDVVGLDYSSEFIEMGRSEATRRKLKVEFVQGDMRAMQYDNQFDGVVCWSNSFGYFSEEENEKVLHSIARSLKREGRVLLDLHNKDAVIRAHLGRRWFEKDHLLILEDWSFDAKLSRSIIKEVIVDTNTGTIREAMMSMREYTLYEMKWMLKDAGLKFIQVYGDTPDGFTTEGFSLDSSLLILAQKR